MCLRQLWTSFGAFWRPLKENWCTGLKNCGARSFYHLGNQSALEKKNICKLCRNWMLKLGPSSYQVTWAAHHELSGILTTKLQYKMCKATLQHQMEVVYVWSGQSRSRRHNQLHEKVAQKPTVLTSAMLPFSPILYLWPWGSSPLWWRTDRGRLRQAGLWMVLHNMQAPPKSGQLLPSPCLWDISEGQWWRESLLETELEAVSLAEGEALGRRNGQTHRVIKDLKKSWLANWSQRKAGKRDVGRLLWIVERHEDICVLCERFSKGDLSRGGF